jgi:hypothetical protein
MRRLIVSAILTALVASVGVGVATSSSLGAGAKRPQAAAASASHLTADVAAARLATAKYVTNLPRAEAAGYGIITRMIPEMGYHFLNPKVSGFSISKPPILVYEHHGTT